LTPPAGASESTDETESPTFELIGKRDRPYWRQNLFKRFLVDQKYLATEWWPAESRRYSFSVPLLVTVAAASRGPAGGNGFDQQWQRSFERRTSAGGGRRIAEGFSRLGDSETAIVLLGGTYLVSRWTGNDRTARAASLSAEALMSTAVYSSLLKRVTRRTRPTLGGTGEFFVDRPEGGQSTNSFPSGHAMGAFAVAAVFSGEFREKRWVPWVAYGTASMIAMSRVALGKHFPSDVAAGALLGQSMGRMVIRRNGEDGERAAPPRWEPIVNPGNGGVGVAYRRSW
jgi:hypothetical protein